MISVREGGREGGKEEESMNQNYLRTNESSHDAALCLHFLPPLILSVYFLLSLCLYFLLSLCLYFLLSLCLYFLLSLCLYFLLSLCLYFLLSLCLYFLLSLCLYFLSPLCLYFLRLLLLPLLPFLLLCFALHARTSGNDGLELPVAVSQVGQGQRLGLGRGEEGREEGEEGK